MADSPLETPASPREAGRPELYVVVLSHLDTQWRWTVRDTASRFLPHTVRENERRFERFPSYRLSFEGAHRYRLVEECHPELWEILRRRVSEGRWFPAGAAWEAFDANLPSPESIVRQILYGTRYFEEKFGCAGRDLFLPDCFGFPRALPTLAVHCGIVGFTTQKLRRGSEMRSAFGVPFPFGRWVGPDGSELPVVLDPGEYGAQTKADLSRDSDWEARFADLAAGGRPAKLMTLQGLGDKGGAIAEPTVAWLGRAAAGDGPIRIHLADSEQLFRELTPDERRRLPVYDGELLLRLHATGCYSSRAQLKRWHRDAEQLAHAAERASAIAEALGLRRADRLRLREAWLRILAHEMHDDLTGTSLVEAYRFSAHDLALSRSELRQELREAVHAVARALEFGATESSLTLFNPLGSGRHDLVEFDLSPNWTRDTGGALVDADGGRHPIQVETVAGQVRGRVAVSLPGLSVTRFRLVEKTVRAGEADSCSPASPSSAANLLVGERFLENARLRVELDAQGDVARLYDKRDRRELLSAPIGLELLENRSTRFPSWEIRWEDVSRPARTRVAGPVRWLGSNTGAACGSIAIERWAEGSRFEQRFTLAAGAEEDAGAELEISTSIDWRSDGALLKLRLPFAADSSTALYDQGIGIAQRGVATEGLYEVPAHRWAAVRSGERSDGAGAVVANDCKYGWDSPAPGTLRLTLLHTPQIGRRFRYQQQQDFGRHEVTVRIAPLAAGESIAKAVHRAERLSQPIRAFVSAASSEADSTASSLGRGSLSFLEVEGDATSLQAMKLAEDGEELVLRLRETAGIAQAATLRSLLPIAAQRPLDGCEREVAAPTSELPPSHPEQVRVPLRAFGLATTALRFGPTDIAPAEPREQTLLLALPRDLQAITARGERCRDGGLDGRGRTLPLELLPGAVRRAGLTFDLEPLRTDRAHSALRCAGQSLDLPPGFARLVLLAASFSGERTGRFRFGGVPVEVRLPDGFAPLGRFDELPGDLLSRLRRRLRLRPSCRLQAGYLWEDPVALALSHHHDRRGRLRASEPVQLFVVELAIPTGAARVELPRGGRVVILAAALDADRFDFRVVSR